MFDGCWWIPDEFGTGRIIPIGLKEEEINTADGLTMASAFIRSRAHDLKRWLGSSDGHVADLQGKTKKDIRVRILPSELRRVGPSASVGILLGLLCLFFKDIKLREGVAITGALSLRGRVELVGDIVVKVSKWNQWMLTGFMASSDLSNTPGP